MREEDSALARNRVPQGECIRTSSRVKEEEREEEEKHAREIDLFARELDLRGCTREGIRSGGRERKGSEQGQRGKSLSNKYREERTHECRQKSPNDQLRLELLRRARLFQEIPGDF